jgi:LysM repeat protein
MKAIPSKFNRRQILGASAALGLGAFLLPGNTRPARAATTTHHLAWVWQFSIDGEPNVVGKRLQDDGLGIILKTHDGVTWMSEYDSSSYAVTGPEQVSVLSNYYESQGIAFHGWCVVHGTNPKKEAAMAAAAVNAGARSLYLDVEPHAGFWRGTPADAVTFAAELRRLAPAAEIILSVDPRPWALAKTPMKEFAPYVDAIAPQQYWSNFDNQANYDRFAESGFPVPTGGVTPDFLLEISRLTLRSFGLPILHVGPGDTKSRDEWGRFINGAYADGGAFVSLWRYGIAHDSVFAALRDHPPRGAQVSLLSDGAYVVQPGDTLSGIAVAFDVSVEALTAVNGLDDEDYIYIGQRLAIPSSGASISSGRSAGGTGTITARPPYVVEDGDTLYSIAGRYGTDVDAIAKLNGIENKHFITIGQRLLLP